MHLLNNKSLSAQTIRKIYEAITNQATSDLCMLIPCFVGTKYYKSGKMTLSQ